MSPDRAPPARRARSSIVVRLLAAFVVVSLLPIVVLAALSLQEAASDPGTHAEEGGTAEALGAHGSLAGIPIEFVELSVAGVSLGLSIVAALHVARTIIRPLRSLEGSMQVVETGNLDTAVAVSTDDEIAHLAAAFNRMVAGLKREALVRDLFGQYVSPEVARLAIEQEGRLQRQVIECTVLFVDIRRFTSLAEVLPPTRLIGILNRYFERMLPVVEAEGGIVNKFGGDSLLAVFGSPINPTADHAGRAVRAALRMRVALAAFNLEQVAEEMPELRVGFGLATGELVAGNIGSSRKREYTVIGDPVNLAARLQELTPELGADVLMNATTAQRASGVAQFRSLGQIEIRGRAEPVEVFSAEAVSPGDAAAVSVGDAGEPAARPIIRTVGDQVGRLTGFPQLGHNAGPEGG